MKTTIIFILLFAFVSPCLAELTENDIRQIRQVMREEMKQEIKPLEDRMSALETRVGNLEKQVAIVEGKMATKDDILAINQNFSDKIDSLNDKINTLYGIIIGSFVTLIIVIAVPHWATRYFRIGVRESEAL
ncbi:MAG: hypothetical protein ACE5PV_01845 [Candidatus Poribacteria bacterium]